MVYQCRAEQLTPRYDLVAPGAILAIDCEGLKLPNESSWRKDGCGRVTVVTVNEGIVLGTFCHYGRNVEHRPHPQSQKLGVKYNDIKPRFGAQYIGEVTRMVTRILDRAGPKGLVVGHSILNDMRMLCDVPWERFNTCDTQQTFFPQTSAKGLVDVAYAVLGRSIRKREHSSIDDARATMALYLWRRNADEASATDSGVGDESSGSENVSGFASSPQTEATSMVQPAEAATSSLEAHRASIPRWIAPGHLVALPDIRELAKGRKFDGRTSTYY